MQATSSQNEVDRETSQVNFLLQQLCQDYAPWGPGIPKLPMFFTCNV